MSIPTQVLIGLLISYALGIGVRPLVRKVKNGIPLPPPREDLKDRWDLLVRDPESDKSGEFLGKLERLVFFIGFWIPVFEVVAGWLALKVASKWQVWSSIIAAPSKIDGIDDLDYVIARRRWGSHNQSSRPNHALNLTRQKAAMATQDKDAAAIWRQSKIPVVYRQGGSEPLMIRLPYRSDNGAWLRGDHRRKPEWVAKYKCWETPKSWFEDVVAQSLRRFGRFYVIQPYRVQEKCAPACWNARGFECECSCMGQTMGPRVRPRNGV